MVLHDCNINPQSCGRPSQSSWSRDETLDHIALVRGFASFLIFPGFIYPDLAPKYNCCPYLALFTYIYLYVAVFRLNYPYLVIFALSCTDITICAIFTLYMHSSIETALLCTILEQSDHYSWRYCT